MAQADSVSQNTQDFFSSYRLAYATGVSLATAGNAVVALPILGGGIGAPFGSGSFIIRRITITNPSNPTGGAVPNMSTANVTVLTSSDGNTSNAVTTAAGQTLTNITGANTWQDLTLIAAAASTAYSKPTLFLLVTTLVANAAVNITVWGDVVQL